MSDTYSVSDYMAETGRDATAATTGSFDDDPDQAARAIELGNASDVPPSAVYGDVDGFERRFKSILSSQLIQNNQHLANYLNSDPMAPKVSHDDLGALDEASDAIKKLSGPTSLSSFIQSISPVPHDQAFQADTHAFAEGFGSIPQEDIDKFYNPYQRPSDVEWALSHPAAAAIEAPIGQAVALGELGFQGLARFTNGLISVGRENIAKHFGEGTAKNFEDLAQTLMDPATQATLMSAGPVGALEAGALHGLEMVGNYLSAYKVAKPFIDIGKEPPPGIHPVIDQMKKVQAQDDIKALEDALTASAKTATRERAPDIYTNLPRDIIANREIGIDPEAVRNLYGDTDPTPDDGKLGFVQDLKSQLEAAEVTGGDVRVPLADWLAKVDPDVAKGLHDDIRVRDNGLTINESKIDAEPKEVIPDHVAMIRGVGGFEPQFMAGDRKITLERKVEAEGDQPKQPWQEGLHDVDIKDENGKTIGTINLSEQNDGKELHVDMIQAGPKEKGFYQPNFLGPSLTRDIARQLKVMFPKAVGPDGKLTITGHRVSGAREKAGSYMLDSATPKVKFQIPEGWGSVEPMRDLLNNFWQKIPGTAVEGLYGPTTLDQQALSEAVRRELQRILPAKVGSVTTPLSIRRRTAEGRTAALGGFHQKFMNDFPKIAAALDAGGSSATALDVLRHEAIHHLRSYGFFKPEEWATLEKAAQENGWLDKYRINQRYPDLAHSAKLEESIAEGYRHWVAGERGKPEVDGIFAKLKEFFDNIKTHFKELTGRDLDWDEIFKKVDTGEVGSREGTGAQPLVPGGRKPFDLKAMAVDEPEGSEEAFGLYDRGKALGVTQSHMDRMLDLIQKRNAEDLQASQRRAEVRQRRRSNKDYKDRRTTLRDDVSTELQQRPDIALDRLFSRQKVKFNPAYLTEDQRARLPKEYIQKKDGINPDDLAPYFGYTSGDALVERLGMLTEDRRRASLSQRDYFNRLVDVETDRRLNAEFGDREQNVLDEAKDQALSETQLNLVHEETMAYAYKAHGENYVPQFTKDQVRDMMREAFAKMPVGGIKSDQLIQAAGKIGKKIEEAGSKGDWAQAYRLSQQRNHSMIWAKLAREYEKQRAQLDRIAKQFRKREVASVPAEYTNWIHDLLQRTGYPINRSIQDLVENIGRQSETTLRDFKDEKERQWLGVRELPVADYLMDPQFRQQVDKLSYHDFMGLKVSIDSLVKAGRDEKKIITQGETMDRETAISEMRDKLESFGYKPTNIEPSRLGKWPRAWIYGLANKETILNRWDRGDKRGIFNRLITYPLADAANAKATLQREVARQYQSLPSIKDLDKLVDAPFTDPGTRSPSNPTGTGPMPNFKRSNVIAMLMNAGNDSNWKVLARGYGADPEALMAWLGRNITKEDLDFATGLGNIFKNLVRKADNVYERMTGATIEKIPLTPRTFKLADGTEHTVPGWYHPLIADANYKTVWVQDPDTGLWSQKAQGKRETFDDLDFLHFATSNGYTKKRTGAIYPLDLNFNATPTRIKQMIHDIAFREVVHEVQKVYGDPRFREDVSKYYGKEYADGLMPYLRAVAGSDGIASKNLAMANQLSELIRQNVISTYIGFNPFTVLKHGPTAAAMSAREVGAGDFFSAVKALYGQSPSVARITHKFIEDNSEEIQRRERNWQDTIVGQGNEIEGAGNLREKIIQKGSAAVAWSDRVSAKPTWLAAYNRARADGLSHGESISLGDRAVRRAHGSTAETNQPPLVQSGGPLHSWLTSVYGFFGTAMQRRIETAYKLNDAWELGKDREIKAASKKLASAFGDFMTYMVWPTIVEEAVQGIGTNDHRTWGSRIISGATMGMASSVLYLRDLIHGAVSGHEPGLGLASSALHDIGEVFRDVGRGTNALSKEHAGKTVGDLLTVVGESTGMAPKIVGNAAKYGINVATGKEKPKTPADILLGVTKGTQKRRQVK